MADTFPMEVEESKESRRKIQTASCSFIHTQGKPQSGQYNLGEDASPTHAEPAYGKLRVHSDADGLTCRRLSRVCGWDDRVSLSPVC